MALHSALAKPLESLPFKEDPIEGVVLHMLLVGILSMNPGSLHANTQQSIRALMPKITAFEAAQSIPDKEILQEGKLNDDTLCAVIRKTLIVLLSSQ